MSPQRRRVHRVSESRVTFSSLMPELLCMYIYVAQPAAQFCFLQFRPGGTGRTGFAHTSKIILGWQVRYASQLCGASGKFARQGGNSNWKLEPFLEPILRLEVASRATDWQWHLPPQTASAADRHHQSGQLSYTESHSLHAHL